jgi:uncharacterized protein (DUF697 family)/tellurite resistance protein
MDLQNQRALLSLALLASKADGMRAPGEGEAIHRALGKFEGGGLDTEAVWNEVERGERDLARAARELTTPEARELAYELAVTVCDSDGATNEKERVFLGQLARELGLASSVTERFRKEADGLAAAPLAGGATPVSEAELDELIQRQAILCGGLELLPQRLATLAILPLQMRLVYQIGKRHGFELDKRHITEFLGVIGVGMASQVIEGFARQLVGGLLGKLGGGLLGGLGKGVGTRAAGVGLSFATTYALGHAAKRYYAGGRKLSALELKELFSSLIGRGRELEGRHADAIAHSARSVDVASLTKLLPF